MKTAFRSWNPGQISLYPRDASSWLPEGHLAYFVLDIVQALDLSEFYAWYVDKDPRGNLAYEPRMMVALLVYGYVLGVRSSRRIERATYEDVAFRMLAAEQHPDHTRISEFRRNHLGPLSRLFLQILELCRKAGMAKLGLVALDGTKMKANASKRKAMSYKRMKDDESKLEAKVREILEEAEAADREEEARLGTGKSKDDLPEDLRRSEGRLERIRKLRKELEEEARRQQEEQKEKERQAQEKKSEGSPTEASPAGPTPSSPPKEDRPALPAHKIPTNPDGKPTDKTQRNFTDPESRIMKSSTEGFVQGFNAQVAVDGPSQLILAHAVTNQSPDAEHWSPMLAQVLANCGAAPRQAVADNGYYSESNADWAKGHGIDPYLATGRLKHGELPVSAKGRPPAHLSAKDRMRRKLSTKRGAAVYAKRKTIVEPVFGQIKEARGIRAFLVRGLEKVRGEFGLIAATHNLGKLFRKIGTAGLLRLLKGGSSPQA